VDSRAAGVVCCPVPCSCVGGLSAGVCRFLSWHWWTAVYGDAPGVRQDRHQTLIWTVRETPCLPWSGHVVRLIARFDREGRSYDACYAWKRTPGRHSELDHPPMALCIGYTRPMTAIDRTCHAGSIHSQLWVLAEPGWCRNLACHSGPVIVRVHPDCTALRTAAYSSYPMPRQTGQKLQRLRLRGANRIATLPPFPCCRW
jgi:hypothetical protein